MTQLTWILVANASEARIFLAEGKDKISVVDTFTHEESRQLGQDLNTDRQGRVGDRVGTARHAVEDHTPAKEVEAQKFAREIANYLDSARTSGKYQRLYLVSSPSFLGLIRGSLSEATLAVVIESISKDLTNVEPGELNKHVFLTFGT